jgi:sRNA-binding protein
MVGNPLPTSFDAGVPLRDVQEAASHADPRTTMRYDRARTSLDRHATYIVAAFIAGAAPLALRLDLPGPPCGRADRSQEPSNTNRRKQRRHAPRWFRTRKRKNETMA